MKLLPNILLHILSLSLYCYCCRSRSLSLFFFLHSLFPVVSFCHCLCFLFALVFVLSIGVSYLDTNASDAENITNLPVDLGAVVGARETITSKNIDVYPHHGGDISL